MKPELDQDGKAIQRKTQYLATYTGRGEFYSGVRTNDPVHVTFGEWYKGGDVRCEIRGVGERAGASLSIYADQRTGLWPFTAMVELTDHVAR